MTNDGGTQGRPVGKSYASIVDDEKMAFSDGMDIDRYKNPATIIIAALADMDG